MMCYKYLYNFFRIKIKSLLDWKLSLLTLQHENRQSKHNNEVSVHQRATHQVHSGYKNIIAVRFAQKTGLTAA